MSMKTQTQRATFIYPIAWGFSTAGDEQGMDPSKSLQNGGYMH